MAEKYDLFCHSLSLKYAVFCIVDMVGLFPVIALPRAIINCGWLGIPLTFTVFLIEIYTAVLLGRCWIIGEKLKKDIIKKKRCPYGALVELAFGKTMSTYVTLILDISIFGACVPDLLIAAQNLQVIASKATRYETELSYCYWLLIIGVIITPMMWLGSPKDMKIIGIISVSVVFLTAALTWSSILTVRTGNINIPEPSWESIAIAYGTLAFQFDVHPMILSVQMDMKNKNDVGKAIIIAFIVSGGLFIVTMILCYNLLGDRVQYNTLQSLPDSGLLDITLFLATLQVCLSMAVGSTPFFQDVEHSLHLHPDFGWRRVVFRSCVVMFAVFLGETVPRFDLLMGLVGGTFTGQLVFLFPPLLYRKLRIMMDTSYPKGYYQDDYGTFTQVPETPLTLYDPIPLPPIRRKESLCQSIVRWFSLEGVSDGNRLSAFEGFWLLTVPALGLGATAVSTFFSFRETIEFAEYAPSCLLNASYQPQYVSY